MARAALLAAVGWIVAFPLAAFGHTGERAFVLLLPTGLYIAGGALAVALSFVVMACMPSRFFARVAKFRTPILQLPGSTSTSPGYFALAVIALLVAAGVAGSRDPLDNPLPLTVWTLWWVGFTFLVALFGNLWNVLNPWRALYRLLVRLARAVRYPPRALGPYPEGLGYWPAALLLLAFGWFELVHPAPQDPRRVADALLIYAVITLAGMVMYGEEHWLEYGEAFSVFFRMVSRLSPFQVSATRQLEVGLPCRALIDAGRIPAGGVAFIVVALASVSFDGLSRTFWWIGLVGENPLEHPGRGALMTVNTLGLLATAAALGCAFVVAVRLGSVLASDGRNAGPVYGDYIVAIVPIAFGYHFAHYLPTFLVDSQYAVRALADPFSLGWNLFGGRGIEVTTSFLSHHASVHAIWNVQVAGIVLAHVAAVFIAHVLALRRHARVGAAIVSQLPMTALMVGYTIFGLWLLATPVAG